MDCYNQFNFSVSTGRTFTSASGDFTPWVSSTNNSWVINYYNDLTNFKIQGFKNINLHGIKLQASIQCGSGGNHGIIEDYSFNLELIGQKPSVSGTFTTNNWNASLYANQYRLTKYQNVMMFEEPIRSLTDINLNYFTAQGYDYQSTINIELDIIAQIFFFFRYEGEDENLLY